MGNQERVIAVLGAGGSLGAAISHQFAGESVAGLVLSDISGPSLEDTIDGMPQNAAPLETTLADVSNFAQVEAVVAACRRAFRPPRCADQQCRGVRRRTVAFTIWRRRTAERAFRVNVIGPGQCDPRRGCPMREQKSGSIILTASVSGMTAWSHASPYCVTKAGVIHLAKVAAVEYARDGIRVNCVCPGTFLSNMHADLPPAALDAIGSKHPLGLGSPNDLVGAYSYLASEASRWTTGSAIVVDGGYSAP